QTDRPSGASDRGDGNAAQSPFACRRYRSADHGQRRGWRFRPEEWGHLRVYSADSPPGLSIYEQATPWGQGPLMSVYNNLILFVGIGLGGRRRAATRPRAALAGIRPLRRSRSWGRYMVG